MRFQGPHDAGTSEKVFINVEQDDTTNTFVLGDLVMWKITDDSGAFTPPNNLYMGTTWGHRIEQHAGAGDAAAVRSAGFVSTLPADMGTATNLHATRVGTAPMELQVYGVNDQALGNGAVSAGAVIESSGVAGAIRDKAGEIEGCQVGFCMDALTDTNRDGVIFIKGLL